MHFVSIIALLVKRDLHVKYRDSILGYLWSMLNPLLTMLVITMVFSHFVRHIDDYSLYVLSGLLFWNMASLGLFLGASSIVSNATLMRKIKIPGLVFPFVALGTSGTNLLFSLVPYTVLFIFFGLDVPAQIYLFPLLLLVFVIFLSGLILMFATLNVFFRDVSHVMEPVLNLVFYATPILYDRNSDMVPDHIATLLLLNPFTHFIEAFRAVIFKSQPITLSSVAIMVVLAGVSLTFGLFLYRRYRSQLIFHL